jgi:flagellar basal body-associated protein FliL
MEQELAPQTKKSSKGKLALVLLVFVLALVGYGYYWYSGILEKSEQAQIILSENETLKVDVEQYNLLKESLLNEYDRCQEFISQREGDFGSFEYCKKFIEWINAQQALR